MAATVPSPLPQDRESDARIERTLLGIARGLGSELHPERRDALERLSINASLERDFGFDSLSRAELLSRVESTLGVALPDSLMGEAETPADILAAVGGGGIAVADGPGPGPRATAPSRVPTAPRDEDDASSAEIPYTAPTLVAALAAHAERHPEAVHATFLDESGESDEIRYGELYAGARRVAAGLAALGADPGSSVALMLPSGRAYFETFLGVLMAGATPVPIYPPVRPSQIESHLRRHARILANAEARAMVTVSEGKAVSRILAGHVPSLSVVTTTAELHERGEREAAPERYVPRGEDLALIQYTSGSTGDPKGVMLTHADLLANIRIMGRAIAVDRRDVFVSWLPLYHDMGLIGAWLGACLTFGARLAIMSPVTFLRRPAVWLESIARLRGTISAAPNFAYEMCVHRLADADLEGLDLSSWRLAFNGAEPVSADAMNRFCTRFAPFGFRREAMAPVFGLAEAGLGLTFPPLGRGPIVDVVSAERLMTAGEAVPVVAGSDSSADEALEKTLEIVACGRPLPEYRLRIADARGQTLPDRREGRVHFQGPSATRGYLRNPAATSELFVDEWLDTGDLGYLADGDLFITRRAKDMIIRGGRNLFPYELEEAVGDLPEVRKGCVAVFGATDPRSGTERVVVLAEVRPGHATDDADEALRGRVQALAVDLLGMPADEVLLAPPGSVLKTSSGKIRRSACRERYEQGRIGSRERPVWLQVAAVAVAGLPGQLARLARRAARAGWGGYAIALTVALGVLYYPVVLAAPLGRGARLARSAVELLRRLAGCRLTVEGGENLAAPGAAARPLLLVANHASYADWLVLLAAVPLEFSFVAKAELSRHPLIGPLLRRLDTLFVDRFDARQSVADAEKVGLASRNGRTLVLFPEGTFRRTPGLGTFRLGAYQAAVQAGAAVVPIAIQGTRSLLPAGSWLPRPASLSVHIGAPIAPDGDDWPAAIRLRDRSRDALAEHLGEPKLAFALDLPANPRGPGRPG